MLQDTYMVASNPFIAHEQIQALNLLFAGESQTKPAHRLGPKVYDFYLMHLVLSGKGIFVLNGVEHPLEAGHIFLIKPEQLISYESDSELPWRYRWVAFNGPQAAELIASSGFTDNKQLLQLNDHRRASILFRQIYMTFRRASPSSDLYAAGYLYILFGLLREALHHASDRAHQHDEHHSQQLHQQVIHYLSTQYTHPVSIEQMAEALGYNRAYLSRIFKKHTGMSPITFLLKLRMDKARHMLRERQELTIEQVAASVGLQDALYFSKQFRKLYGRSPTAYRQEMRKIPPSI